MSLDQGSFDVVIVPAAGSGFPIVVSANRSVFPASDDLDLGTFKVPAPVHLRYTVKDPNANVIARALVRAYTLGTETVPPVEIGRAMTDTSGVFDMFLSPGGL